MEFSSIGEAARFGMTFERSRLEAASYNIALANVAYSSVSEAQEAANVISQNIFNDLIDTKASGNEISQIGVKTVHDPKHPIANANGDVFFVDVDPIKEMATMTSAIRAYEANVRAYNTNGEMNSSARSIGGQR